MKEIAKEAWNYTFSERGPGDYILSVVCGGVGLYDFAIRLTAPQVAAYEHEGIPYISRLAEQVRHDQSPFNAQKA
ncbi:hypothetical protein SAMN05216327_105477 [Dyadobacter sp. SG02]|uniref:hypothetical protein n=1 Tax=Dyadobacter sp. SG02 TaxID=1855291 RepID=UPI0008B31CB7|nr:hypothetical protein [Dyadobacter sp. SG02]SEJ05053.1 hypothetical protein SAMN05216327_105477 [Dyadobacter sp. SG02]